MNTPTALRATPSRGPMAAAPNLPVPAWTARGSLACGEAAACKARWPSGKAGPAAALGLGTSLRLGHGMLS